MKRKDLTGYRFTDSNDIRHVIIAGYEGGEIAFKVCGKPESALNFCCDASVVNGKLSGSYQVSYTVSEKEFFAVVDNLNKDKLTPGKIASELKHTYYKIPTVFLNLVGETYLKGRK